MKLVYPFPEPLPLERARGVQTVHTVAALAAHGVEVLLAYVPAGDDPFAAYAMTRPAGVELAPVSHRLPWPLGRVHSNRFFAARLARLVDRDVRAVLARHLKVACLLAERFPELPLVYEAHEVFADTAAPARRAAMRRLEGRVVARAAALVANSGATARRLRELYPVAVPLEVIPNGVDYPQTLPGKDWTLARERVIYAGSFFGWKGVEDLVAAAARLPGFGIRLLGGDAAGIARLRALYEKAAGAGGARVDFAGRVPHGEVAGELARACIAVLPNRADPDSAFTSPIKLFEYMAAGCALVASDLPSVREVLATDDAEWVAPGDAAGLAAAIRALADDPARASRMGERVREKARAYTWSARGERLARIVRPLLAGP
ncbi:MAG TPA: glycosyltransferase family 4 protein [Burkholderiales bacterium]|nr:glycosyltransferase family 4 protein [Burkholderiales bacterium]